MNRILVQRLIALADSFDKQGKVAEAAALDKILTEANDSFERKRSIARVLLQVANSLDAKGAVKEAQMADQLVSELADADLSFEQAPSDAGTATQTEIKSVPRLDPEYDEISLDDLRKVRDSSALRFTQRHDREAYDRAISKAEQAKQYKDAFEQWLEAAHKELGDRPLRLKL